MHESLQQLTQTARWTREYTRYKLIDSLRRGSWFLFSGSLKVGSFGWTCRACRQEGLYKPSTRTRCPVCGDRKKFQAGKLDSNAALDRVPELNFRAVAFDGTQYVAVKCDTGSAYEVAEKLGLELVQQGHVKFEQDAMVVVTHEARLPSFMKVKCRGCDAHKLALRKEKWLCDTCTKARQNWWAKMEREKQERYALVTSQLSQEGKLNERCRHGLTHTSCSWCFNETLSKVLKRWVEPPTIETPFDLEAETLQLS